jgi:hypothetical protein
VWSLVPNEPSRYCSLCARALSLPSLSLPSRRPSKHGTAGPFLHISMTAYLDFLHISIHIERASECSAWPRCSFPLSLPNSLHRPCQHRGPGIARERRARDAECIERGRGVTYGGKRRKEVGRARGVGGGRASEMCEVREAQRDSGGVVG